MPHVIEGRQDFVNQPDVASGGMVLAPGLVRNAYVRDVLVSGGDISLIAQTASGSDHGLWHSKLEDVHLHNHTLYIRADEYGHSMRDLDFDRIVAEYTPAPSIMSGEVSRCRFRGGFFNGPRDLAARTGTRAFQAGQSAITGISPSSVVFTGTSFQMAQYGVHLSGVRDFHFINCWFEDLDVAVYADQGSCVRLTNCTFQNVRKSFGRIAHGTKVVVDGYIAQGCPVTDGAWIVAPGMTGTYIHELGQLPN